MKKKLINLQALIALVAFICLSTVSVAQVNSSVYNQVAGDFLNNPALSGRWNYSQVSLNYQSDWLGYEGSPRTINAHGNFIGGEDNKYAYGFTLNNDRFGFHDAYNLGLSYSYNVINQGQTLSIGVLPKLHLLSTEIANSDQQFVSTSNQVFDQGRDAFFDIDMGIFYASAGPEEVDEFQFFVGASAQNFFQTNVFDSEYKLINRTALAIAGIRTTLGEFNYLEPRVELTYDLDLNYLKTIGAKLFYENYDMDRWKANYGFYGLLAANWNNSDVIINSLSLNASAGVMLKMGKSSGMKGTDKMIRAGVYYSFGIGELFNARGQNLGITVNFLLHRR